MSGISQYSIKNGNEPARHCNESSGEEADIVHGVEAMPEGRSKENGHHAVALRHSVIHTLAQPTHCSNVPVVQDLFRVRAQLMRKLNRSKNIVDIVLLISASILYGN